MQQSRYQIRFNTPAFLGNSEQSGQWRSPPFKAQLRQWWRVAYAARHGYRVDVQRMLEAEGRLFGHAGLDSRGAKVAAQRSEVRLRLEHWSPGKLMKSHWQPLDGVQHPEVKVRPAADLYLGFGPVASGKGTPPTLKANAAIQAEERNTLSLAYPAEKAELMACALALMDRYGSIGGRSRNGWGSYQLLPQDATPPLPHYLPVRPWLEALELDWPHAIGRDETGVLAWQTRGFEDWRPLMRLLAEVKIGLRTQFRFELGKNSSVTEKRHWLAYPVTNHSVSAWGTLRLPNSLRFKVRRTVERKLVGIVFHMPCLPPPAFKPNPAVIADVWRSVHGFLDAQSARLNRVDA